MRPPLLSAAALAAALCLVPAAPAQQDVKTQWEALVAKNNQFAEKVEALETEFETADAARKAEIETEFNAVVRQYQSANILPQMAKLAGPVFEADPSNVTAGQRATEFAYGRNDYAAAERYAEKLLETDPGNVAALNIRGLSEFSQNKFGEAQASLAAAKQAGTVSPDFARIAGDLPQLEQDWAAEQAIRQKQADANLPRVQFTVAGPDGKEKGKVVIELFEEEAPNTVANIVSLVESGFYDGIRFHRVLPHFMDQVGDPNTKDPNADPRTYGSGGPGYVIEDEFNRPGARKHFAGSLSMAKTPAPDTGGSQFFITRAPTPFLDGKHTVFGRVVEGMETVRNVALADPDAPGYEIEETDVIQKATVLNKRNHPYEPKTLAER